MKKRIVFVRSNRLDQEIRLPKEIDILQKAGHNIIIINWDRDNISKANPEIENVSFKQFKMKASYGRKSFFFLPFWWIFIFWNLLKFDWDVVHSVNWDCQLPAFVAGKLKNKKIVYELLDILELSVYLSGIPNFLFSQFDKIMMKYSDAVIVADEMQIMGVGGIPNDKILALYDSAPLELISVGECQKDGIFTLFYAGVLYSVRRLNMINLLHAIKDLPDVRVIIAGDGDLVEDIKKWEMAYPGQIKFIGKISYKEVLNIGMNSDLFFVLRDSSIPANKYTCGSTLFNAMICGKPILVNKNTSTAYIVEKEKCGIVIDAQNINEIRDAVVSLKENPELCRNFGKNGRNAYEHKYSWEIMGKKLAKLYEDL